MQWPQILSIPGIISDVYALEAIKLIYKNLLNTYQNPKELKFREKMALGSLLSGLAFSNTKTTAVHSVSYPMTLHFDVPHGLACALTLGQFLIYNSEKTFDNIKESPKRIKKISEILGASSADIASNNIYKLMKKMGLSTKLHQEGINENGIELIIKEGFTPHRVKHNPRDLSKENLREILYKVK